MYQIKSEFDEKDAPMILRFCTIKVERKGSASISSVV